jgi:two-component system response regulator YesN
MFDLYKEKDMLLFYSKFLYFLSILCSNSGIVPSSAISQNSNISRALDYIKNNLQTVNLDELSKYLHLNKNYLCRQFKLETGLTVMEHVKLQRITLAKEKLIQTDMSIADIVDSIGFSNISYFCNLFKKHEGIPPSLYRKKRQLK